MDFNIIFGRTKCRHTLRRRGHLDVSRAGWMLAWAANIPSSPETLVSFSCLRFLPSEVDIFGWGLLEGSKFLQISDQGQNCLK